MDTVTFTGEQPIEISLQQLPAVSALGESVGVTLPVFALGFPQQTVEIRVVLTIEEAEHLAAQIGPAILQAVTLTRK